MLDYSVPILMLIAVACILASRHYSNKVEAIDKLPRLGIAAKNLEPLFEQLRVHGADGSFASLLFKTNEGPDYENTLAAQWSIKEGRVGFDWVLLSPLNIEEAGNVVQFAAARGFKLRECKANGVRYLRVAEGDVLCLCRELLFDHFCIEPLVELQIVTDNGGWTNAGLQG